MQISSILPLTINRVEERAPGEWRKEVEPASYLECHGVGDDQEDPQGQPSFITPVTPQAMGSCCYAQGTQHIVEKP